MTRHGSLAYYLASWVCGCFFMSLSLWLAFTLHFGGSNFYSMNGAARNVWLFCFFGWVWGAGMSILGAFLLRRIAHALQLRNAIGWVAFKPVRTPVWTISSALTLSRRAVGKDS